MAFAHDSLAVNAMGGTELMKYGLQKRIPAELLDEFQIIVSRIDEKLDESKIRIYWLHDLPGDPAADHLRNGGWNKFHRLVFASNWQMQAFINYYDIPWSKCIVLQNAIEPIPQHEKPTDGTIRLAYWSTPHRGLNILVPVFDKLCEKYDNIELDVYSSFKLYGWEERDKQFEALFEACRNHPKINYHGAIPNEELRKNLEKTHILAYPSIWQETSCITLMEAMSAGIVSVHSNLGALHETSAGWSHMYQYHEDLNAHAHTFYQVLDGIIENYWDEGIQSRAQSGKSYANVFYNWEFRKLQWEALLRSLINEPREISKSSGDMFVYRT
jgi:UDP-glucose:(glucosyl)LPS alpha-1,2-glucosyltransferase